jgi:predicted HTH domain antitoxin
METLNTKKITIEFPIDALSALRQTSDEFARELRLTAAVKWYEMGLISQEKASEIAGLCREEFIQSLGRYNVSPFQYSPDEVLKETGYAK